MTTAATDLLRHRLQRAFRWEGDRDDFPGADMSGWWADRDILSELGPALAALHVGPVDAVIAPEASGLLVGALTAQELGVGLIAVSKDPEYLADSARWWTRTSPPDYRDRHLRMGVPHRHLPSGLRVLFVDDWVDTGGQAVTVQRIAEDAGAIWVGAAVVDALASSRIRRDLAVRALLNVREL